jgi:hypothetical protein
MIDFPDDAPERLPRPEAVPLERQASIDAWWHRAFGLGVLLITLGGCRMAHPLMPTSASLNPAASADVEQALTVIGATIAGLLLFSFTLWKAFEWLHPARPADRWDRNRKSARSSTSTSRSRNWRI